MTTSAYRFGLLTAAAIAGAAITGPGAQAAVLIFNGVYEASISKTCNASRDCEVVFPNVPAGKTLHMTHMSCWSQFTNTASVLVMGLDGSPRHSFVAPIEVGRGNGFKNIAVSAEVLKLYRERANPKIRLVLTNDAASIFLECQVAGPLKP